MHVIPDVFNVRERLTRFHALAFSTRALSAHKPSLPFSPNVSAFRTVGEMVVGSLRRQATLHESSSCARRFPALSRRLAVCGLRRSPVDARHGR